MKIERQTRYIKISKDEWDIIMKAYQGTEFSSTARSVLLTDAGKRIKTMLNYSYEENIIHTSKLRGTNKKVKGEKPEKTN